MSFTNRMARFTVASFVLALVFTAVGCQGQEKKQPTPKKPAVTFYLIDTALLEASFWKMNSMLTEGAPPARRDTMFRITDLLQKRVLSVGNKPLEYQFHPLYIILASDTGRLLRYTRRPDLKKALTPGVVLAFGPEGRNDLPGPNRYMGLFPLLAETAERFDSADIDVIRPTLYSSTGTPAILLKLTPAAAKRLEAFSRRYFKKQIAIVLNGTVYSEPMINGVLTNGTLEIATHLRPEDMEPLLGVPF